MADKTPPTASEQQVAEPSPAATPVTQTAQVARRVVTVPVLPLAITSAVIVALLFFCGGVAVGFAIGDHPVRTGVFLPFAGPNGQNRFGPHDGLRPNDGQRPHDGLQPSDRPTVAPKNG